MTNQQLVQVIRDQAPIGFRKSGSAYAIKRRITTLELIEEEARMARQTLLSALEAKQKKPKCTCARPVTLPNNQEHHHDHC